MNVKIKGESEEYRKLRAQLLEAEIALKDQTERVAVLRRQLPAGPAVETDYIFREGPIDLCLVGDIGNGPRRSRAQGTRCRL